MASPREEGRHSAALAAGDVLLAKFRIERVLGQGGMGVVYAAHHMFLDRPVAIKLLAQHAAMNPEALARFLNEARNAARIDHEYVCRVMDLGVLPDGLPYIAMELLEGVDLGSLLATRGPLPPVEAVGYVIQALTGIGEAHLKGVIHRDLKPSNLFLATKTDGRRIVKVLDFGISKATDAPNPKALTSMNNVVGSPGYMSPEQVIGSVTLDGRADIWAVGVILYELLTGTLPFGSANVGNVLTAILEKEPVPIASRRAGIPPGLAAVITACLEKDVDRRVPSAAALALALAPYGPWAAAGPHVGALPDAPGLASQGIGAPGQAGVPTVSTWARKRRPEAPLGGARYPAMILLGAVIGLLFVAVGWLVLSRRDQRIDASASAPAVPAHAAPGIAASSPLAPAPIASAASSSSTSPTAEPLVSPPASATASAAAAPSMAPSASPSSTPRRRPGLSRQRQ